MPTKTVECNRCQGAGGFAHEDAPGCYSDHSACGLCGGTGETNIEVEPCDECAQLVSPDVLTWAADGRWRCPHCHLRVVTKIHAGEHPAVDPEDWTRTTAGNLVHISLFLSAVFTWWVVLS